MLEVDEMLLQEYFYIYFRYRHLKNLQQFEDLTLTQKIEFESHVKVLSDLCDCIPDLDF